MLVVAVWMTVVVRVSGLVPCLVSCLLPQAHMYALSGTIFQGMWQGFSILPHGLLIVAIP